MGAALGAIAVTVASLLAVVTTARIEQRRNLRSRREEAYSQAIKALLQVEGTRSTFNANGYPVVAKEHQALWFDRLIEARHALHQATVYASSKSFQRLSAAALELDLVGDAQLGVKQELSRVPVNEKVAEIRQIVVNSSREDLASRLEAPSKRVRYRKHESRGGPPTKLRA